jgi:oligoribonuclease NrnB/cAMP/cGMP phosphodiesterase (DHH superfamily)
MQHEYQTNEEELLAKHLANAEKVIESRNEEIEQLTKRIKLLESKPAEAVTDEQLQSEAEEYAQEHVLDIYDRCELSAALISAYIAGRKHAAPAQDKNEKQ